MKLNLRVPSARQSRPGSESFIRLASVRVCLCAVQPDIDVCAAKLGRGGCCDVSVGTLLCGAACDVST